MAHNEGVAQALRNMIELSTIELTGKLLRLPYWGCLNINVADAEVQREMEDWFLSMQGTLELTRFAQDQLRNRSFYDGPADGVPNAPTGDALASSISSCSRPSCCDRSPRRRRNRSSPRRYRPDRPARLLLRRSARKSSCPCAWPKPPTARVSRSS